MRFSFTLSFLAVLRVQSATEAYANDVFHPHRVSYEQLISVDDSFSESKFIAALTQYGIISISGIPHYVNQKENTLANLHQCALISEATKEHTFPDGTRRLTMATHTVPGPGGRQDIKHNVARESDTACSSFSGSVSEFRDIIRDTVGVFSSKLASTFEMSKPLLSTNDGYDFDTFEKVVENGEYLEHFHSYQLIESNKTSNENHDSTIEWHTDQGLFIAIAPAMTVDTAATSNDKNALLQSLADFYIKMTDGSHALVEIEKDDLVIMLGDGVNQYINGNLKMGEPPLRATPHALNMQSHGENQARVWYGLMVLPPEDALYPDTEETFGQLRQQMIEASVGASLEKKEVLGLACSGDGVARQLEETTCEAGTTYCWHRCMPHIDFGISLDMCGEKKLQVKCINPRGQVADSGHGDFYPACTNSTELITPYPRVPEYPQDPDVCTSQEWNKFSSSKGYKFVFDKLGDNRGNRKLEVEQVPEKGSGQVARLMWNIDGEKIDGKLVFNGQFGYLAFGFANPGGKHNGMNGASIIMAIPGGNYTAKYGFDLSRDASIAEWVINEHGSSFRHWTDPLPGRDLSSYKIETTSCFTAISWNTDNINDIKFNTAGTDDLIWAGNLQDSFCGYHGRGVEEGPGDRDRFIVEWATGRAWFLIEMEQVAVDDADKMNDTKVNDAESSAPGYSHLGLVLTIFAITLTFN